MGVLICIYLWFWIAQSVKRCHDVGNSGFYILIPFYGIWLFFESGDNSINKYGSEPNEKYDMQIGKETPKIEDEDIEDREDHDGQYNRWESNNENKDDGKAYDEKGDESQKAILVRHFNSNKGESMNNIREEQTGRISDIHNEQKEPRESTNEESHFNISSFIDHYCRLLFVCWVVISVLVEVLSYRERGWGILALLILLVVYFAVFWVYDGFRKVYRAKGKKKL